MMNEGTSKKKKKKNDEGILKKNNEVRAFPNVSHFQSDFVSFSIN